jgi:hypothetical protein
MAFNVAEFRANMVGDGARPNLFQVSLVFPTFAGDSVGAGQKLTFMAKAAQLPGATLGTVPVYYFGRELKFVGNRSFADWTITVINDENFQIRRAFESWMNGINAHGDNVRTSTAASPADYSSDAVVNQYDKTGNIIKSYKFVGAFPVDLSPIDLDWGSNDTIEEFTMTMAYQWWETDSTT